MHSMSVRLQAHLLVAFQLLLHLLRRKQEHGKDMDMDGPFEYDFYTMLLIN